MTRFLSALTLPLALALANPAGAAETHPATRPIPALDSKGDVYKTEGETDPLIYKDAIGRKKLIMLYLDFPDAEMAIDTRERAQQVLGGKTFEDLFARLSHGKLSFDIEQMPGWRRLPGKAGDYSSKTTEAHRDLFVAVFKLYPEIDFSTYDYIVANMPKIGNTAFGEREDIAIPYRGGKIKLALNLSSPSPYVLAHECGHLMGLPDVYTYGGVPGPKNPAGPWDLMSEAGKSSGFLGWQRHKLKWLDADRKTYLSEGDVELTITPLDAASGLSMVVIPADDPKHPSKVFVIEVAQQPRLKKEEKATAPGILVYTVDAKLASGNNPIVVYPNKDLRTAPFLPGEFFEHEDAPFLMKVIESDPQGAFQIEIRFDSK
jgi:hypothetical protein